MLYCTDRKGRNWQKQRIWGQVRPSALGTSRRRRLFTVFYFLSMPFHSFHFCVWRQTLHNTYDKKRIGSLNTEFSQITAQNTHISKKHDPTWKLNITELVNQWFKICDTNFLSTVLTLNHRTTLIQHRWFIAPARKKRKTPFTSDSRQLYSREKIDTVIFICLPSNVLEIFSLARKIYSLNNLAVSRCLKNTHQKLLWKYANHSDFKSQNYSAVPPYFQYWIDCSRCNSTKHLIS